MSAIATQPTVEKKPAPAPLDVSKIIGRVDVRLIDIAPDYPRLKECEDLEKMRVFADGIAEVGMFHPIGLQVRGHRYNLLWGSRRLSAHLLKKAPLITAAIVPAGVHLDAEKIRQMENDQRLAMNPLEECMECESTLAKQPADLPIEKRIAAVAAVFGKSPTWVRDRLYLKRLCPDARAKVIDCTIPLAFARELSKVVDPETQRDLIKRNFSGHYRPDLEEFRAEVGEMARSLAQVPWKLDVAGVAKGCPACTTCPDNSANAGGLFEHDGKAPALGHRYGSSAGKKGSFCLNASCYQRKAEASKTAIAAAVKVADKDREAKKPAEKIESALDATPAFVDPRAVRETMQQAQVERGSGSSGGSSYDSPENQRKRAAAEKKRKADRARKEERKLVIAAHLAKIPGAMATIFILQRMARMRTSDIFGSLMDYHKGDKASVPPALAKLLSAAAAGKVTIKQLDELVVQEFTPDHAAGAYVDLKEAIGTSGKLYLAEKFEPAAAKPPAAAAAKPKAKGKAGKKGR